MDRRFNSQAGLYEILERADAVPGILDISIGQWLAWPAIKVLVYARFFNALDDSPMAMPPTRRIFRGASLGSKLPSTWLRLRSALSQVPARSDRPRIAWLSGSYRRRGVDGVERDALFGSLPSELLPHAEEIWLQPPQLNGVTGGVHAEAVYEIATDWANQLTSLQRFRPAVRAAADALAAKLMKVTPQAGSLSWQRVCLDAVSMFEARRIAWTKVFDHVKPDVVLMTNAPYLSGEVAAAKSCRVVVAEFQHGLFGSRCPEYGWAGSLASKRAQMPVADRLFVFGDLFRAVALENGFWGPNDVRAIGSAAIEYVRGAATETAAKRSPDPRVMFLTQPMTRGEAIAFWRGFLSRVEAREFPRIMLTIKVHPSEANRVAEYGALAAEFPGLCRIAMPSEDANRLMLEHDLIAGFTSYGLIEAVGLGRAAVSISGEQTPGGIFALCPIPGALDAIPTVSSPEALAALIPASIGAKHSAASGFFFPQTAGTLLEASLDLLRTARQSAHAA
jgi:hypothetical protein